MNSDTTLENTEEESDTPEWKYHTWDIYNTLRKIYKSHCSDMPDRHKWPKGYEPLPSKWPIGYRPDSIKQLYHPEYIHERSGEKLFKLIQEEFMKQPMYRELLRTGYPGDEYDFILRRFVRHMKRFATFIRYRLDSTWCRRIVSLIGSEYPDKGMDFIFTLWCYSKQIIVLDSELAVMLIKQAHIEYITGKQTIYD